jgi:predicted membrane-bound dolichyl-phosphate-mannose-protein mannosyltransferase
MKARKAIGKKSSDKMRKICTVFALILTFVFAFASFKLATEIQGASGYAVDEIYYVSSARNILREFFNFQPSYVDSSGGNHYTIFFRSYSDLSLVRENFRDFIKINFDGCVTHEYSKTAAVAIVTYGELDRGAVLSAFPGVKIIQSGFHYPDVYNTENYLNMEHPPMVKYIIGFFMFVMGDQPISWRMPSVIIGSITLLLLYFLVAGLINYEIALLVFLFAFADPVFRAMSSVAMLDIYVAFFIALSALFAAKRRYLFSALSIGLGLSCKLTGLFSAGALFLVMVSRKSRPTKCLTYPFAVPFLIWFSFNFPFIAKLGLGGWAGELFGGLKWFISSRPPGPPVSAPWGWFVNENPFVLNFSPDVSASVNPAVYLLALIAMFFIPYLVYRRGREHLIPALWFASTFSGYIFVYIMGNRTMYSFYVVTLSPMAYALACALVYCVSEPQIYKEALKLYRSFLAKCRRSFQQKVRRGIKQET